MNYAVNKNIPPYEFYSLRERKEYMSILTLFFFFFLFSFLAYELGDIQRGHDSFMFITLFENFKL